MSASMALIDLARSYGSHPVKNGAGRTSGPTVAIGKNTVSEFTVDLLRDLAREAGLSRITVTSVKRTPGDQARILFNKHVLGSSEAKYANKQVAVWLKQASQEHADGWSNSAIIQAMTEKIIATHGGPSSVSKHCVNDPTLEVVDVAHYSEDKNKHRTYAMTNTEANAFLAACLQRVPLPILRIGHSGELGITDNKHEFVDERCFHLEIRTSAAGRKAIDKTATIEV